MNRIKKILVPTDGSEQAMQAAQYAAEIARCEGAEVVLLYAAPVTGVTQFVAYAIPNPEENLEAEMRETGEEIIRRSKAPFLEADIQVRSKIIEGPPADIIISEARDGGYDMIAMGSRGAGTGLIRRVIFGLGSVAERVVGNAPCPVLVARS